MNKNILFDDATIRRFVKDGARALRVPSSIIKEKLETAAREIEQQYASEFDDIGVPDSSVTVDEAVKLANVIMPAISEVLAENIAWWVDYFVARYEQMAKIELNRLVISILSKYYTDKDITEKDISEIVKGSLFRGIDRKAL